MFEVININIRVDIVCLKHINIISPVLKTPTRPLSRDEAGISTRRLEKQRERKAQTEGRD